MTYILIILSLVTTSSHMRGDQQSTAVSAINFGTVESCRSAAQEVARQNAGHGVLRMSCVPNPKEAK